MTQIAPISTINDLFRRIAVAANPRAVLWEDELGQWQPISSDQIYQRVRALAQVFLGWGVQKGDRIALIAENRWEWAVTDFATLAIGAVDVPIYPTLTGEQEAVLLRDAGCRIAVVSTRQQFEKLSAVRGETELERIVLMDSLEPPEGAIAFSALLADADARGSERDPVFDALVRAVEPKDLATLIYTSGTTGEPKGVALTHGNIAANQNFCGAGFNFNPADSCISFLPLSHITARALDYVMYYYGAQVAYCSKFDKLPQAMRAVKPTVIVGVPRVYEKIRQVVEQRSSVSPVKKRILAWAVGLGSAHSETVYGGRQPSSLLWKLADKLVYSKVSEAFGGRVRAYVSGGAPLGMDTAQWFASVGIAIREGYGLTETSPVLTSNYPNNRVGSSGKPIANVLISIASDGEILARGPCIMQGYYKSPDATREVIGEDGWFHTGDIGYLDSDNYLFITDRKKDLLKTAAGKFVAPQPIENALRTSPYILNAMVVGDQRKFVVALLVPNPVTVESKATEQGIKFASNKEMVAHPWVHKLIEDEVARLTTHLAQWETIKRFALLPEDFTYDNGGLTFTMKLKRRVVEQKYRDVIEQLYADVAEPRPILQN